MGRGGEGRRPLLVICYKIDKSYNTKVEDDQPKGKRKREKIKGSYKIESSHCCI
jgi:hypothetical protein